MNRQELMAILPHRGKMLLIDEARVEDGAAYGSYTVSGDEWFLDGHFPGNPVVPGVVLCEILAQSACVLLEREARGATPMLTGMSDVRFKAPVTPGDTVRTRCEIVRAKPPFYFAAGQIEVRGGLCLKAEFSFALIKERV